MITIDGPAGSGKSSTARAVARRLGFLHLDSGALYRAFAHAACERGWAGPDGSVPGRRIPELARLQVSAEATPDGVSVRLEGRELEEELRTQEVTACASRVSAHGQIRERVNQELRRLADEYEGGIVTEGRDMGTIVFPDADLKVYMTASPEARARRRLAERDAPIDSDSVRAETARLLARDAADSERSVAPLRQAPDAHVVDTSELSFEEQVERLVALARGRLDTG